MRVIIDDDNPAAQCIQCWPDSDGTHHLAPVDEYEVVKKETWERNRNLLKDAQESLSALMCGSQAKALHDFLAEIGGE